MAGRKHRLGVTVWLRAEDGSPRGFGPGDTVPDWARKQITNPDVWLDEDEDVLDESDGDSTPPPMHGAGAGKDAWAAYAADRGVVDVPEDAKRGDIIALLTAAGIPTE